ncbi:MAG: uroporphyrinogen decarboxylase family protein [Verrucomicrobiota bacterium]
MANLTGKQRMLNAYRGIPSDRPAVAPEFWYYYPAKILGVDMIRFQREVPFHQALKTTFETFNCEGWGLAFADIPNGRVTVKNRDIWVDPDTLEIRSTINTSRGPLTGAQRLSRQEPGWTIERPVKDLTRDLPAWEEIAFGGEPEAMNVQPLVKAWEEVGETYLLEAYVGVPFFDCYASAREGGFETGIYDLMTSELEPTLEALRQKHIELMTRTTRVICERTPLESLFIGCSWSCNSLMGPELWRRWDKPVIRAVVEEAHRHGRLVHIHFHGRCLETVADFAELGIDCVCPFERPPGGDVAGLEGLQHVARLLNGRTTMNGNVHTVETLIRGVPDDVRREVREIREAFRGNPRVIIGTGDQVGRETPMENLTAMIDEAKRREIRP